MKFFTACALLMAGAANAFAPSGFSRPTTSLNIVDPEMFHHIATNCADASHVQFVNCDGGECELLDAYHEQSGDWTFQTKGPASPDMWEQKSSVVMMEMDDTE